MQKHKILAFLIALLVSIGLWVYAVTVVNPNDTVKVSDVRVRIIGTGELDSNSLMITGGEDQTVNVEIAGRRSDLKELTSASLEAIADVSNIDKPGVYEVSWTLDPPSTVASGDISLVSTNSNKISVKISEKKERPSIPIEVEYEGTLPDGYVLDPAVLSSETLSATGPIEEVEKITRAVISVNLDGVKQTLTDDFEYRLLDENDEELELSSYVSLSIPAVRVSVPVSCYKQIPLKVSLIAGGGAAVEDAKCTIEPSTIGVSGSEEALAELDELVIKEIDLAQFYEEQTWTVKPELPAGVTNRAADSSVKINLSFSGLVTKKFTVSCSDIERLDDEDHLDFGEQNVVIIIRGKADAVNALSEDDIVITVDMKKDYDPATKTVTLKIQLPADSKAGVVGAPYTVQVIDRNS